jgi:hypothetical protein
MHPPRVAKRLVDGNPEGIRKVRRARWRWILDVDNNVQELKEKQWRENAKNRDD